MIALPFSAALSQNPTLKTRSKEEREERSSATHRIVMNVQVTNASGNPVSDLRAEEFSLYDNQKARKIVAFHPIDGAARHAGRGRYGQRRHPHDLDPA